jgi:hypothetical protein
MSCDHSTYCNGIVDLVPRSSLASDTDDYVTPAEANLERFKLLQQSRPGLTADRSKSKGHEVGSRTVPDSTQTDPEYVWGDEGPIND